MVISSAVPLSWNWCCIALKFFNKDWYEHVHFQVNYINAHATSTIVGDLAELNAIKKVFKDTSEIKINATKVSTNTATTIDF